MNKRAALTKCVIFLTLFAGITISAVFLGSFKVNPKAENHAWLEIDVSEMKPGDVINVGAIYFVYKRIPSDLTNNHKKYVIFNGWAPRRGCGISFNPPGTKEYRWGKRKPFENKPHFYEPCDGGIWDVNGKHVKDTGHPDEQNLIQRKYKFSKHGTLLMHRGKV